MPAAAQDASSRPPRSAYDQVAGLVYFARMLDKIRLHARGLLPDDYFANLGTAFDGRCCRFLGVDYDDLRAQVLAAPEALDEEVFEWCCARGKRPNEEQVLVWNHFMCKRGWRDGADGSTAELEVYKAGSGLAHRRDLLTFFDYYDVDEGRRN